jgi:hypothetical protein
LANNPDKLAVLRPRDPIPGVRDSFCIRANSVRALITLLTIVLVAQFTNAQSRAALKNILHEKAAFDESDFGELERGEPVVRRLPPNHKQEVSVYGLVRVQVPAEVFLQSFRDSIATKNNRAILEIGRFGSVPKIEDLRTLTMESQDIEDLKKCVVANCELKLSAKMIEQFQKGVDWQATDYADQATRLYRQILLDYVRDYLQRGDAALIEYNDKPTAAPLLEGQRALLPSLPGFFNAVPQNGTSVSGQGWSPVENAIVWSKIKLGLKPVLAINHIVIFKTGQEFGPHVVVLSKQIYANHYFDASIALTGLATNPSGNHYLFYENHSLADGLQGLFTGIKRRLIEREALVGLKGVLRETRARLDTRAVNQGEVERTTEVSSTRLPLRIPRKSLLFLLICMTALAMLVLASYQRKANIPPGTHAR